jgi:hypothetical protein
VRAGEVTAATCQTRLASGRLVTIERPPVQFLESTVAAGELAPEDPGEGSEASAGRPGRGKQVEHIEAPAPVHATRLDSLGDPSGMAKLSVEEPDALMHARPGPWEPWRVTARATQPEADNARASRGGNCRPQLMGQPRERDAHPAIYPMAPGAHEKNCASFSLSLSIRRALPGP